MQRNYESTHGQRKAYTSSHGYLHKQRHIPTLINPPSPARVHTHTHTDPDTHSHTCRLPPYIHRDPETRHQHQHPLAQAW